MIQTLRIPGYLPPTLNAMLYRHWAKASRLKKECHDLIAGHALEQGLVKATGRRRVTLTLTLAGRKKVRDGDSSFKAVLDGLVRAGLLLDDSPDAVEVAPMVQERGEAVATTITLEDLG